MSMRLIDADALLESGICAEYGYNDNGLLLIPMRDVINSIRNAPTIDAKPVRHGRWIKVLGGNGLVSTIRCSECDNCDNASYIPGNYCWFCGAKMDGDDENAHEV